MSGASDTMSTVPSGPIGPSTDLIAPIQRMLRKALTDPERATRAPRGLDHFMQSLGNADSTRLMIPFLQAGLMVWYAYFRASQRDSHVLFMVSKLPLDYLRRIATEIKTIFPHDTVRQRVRVAFEQVAAGKGRINKLRSILVFFQSDPIFCVPDLKIESILSVDLKIRQQSKESISSPGSSCEYYAPLKSVGSITEQRGQDSVSKYLPPVELAGIQYAAEYTAEMKAAGQEEADVDTYDRSDSITRSHPMNAESLPIGSKSSYPELPRAVNLSVVFPRDLCESVVKINELASVLLDMNDPANCCMTLEISSASVELIASDLFGVRLRFLPQERQFCFENGVRLISDGSVELSGANAAKVDKLLGPRAGKAFRESPHRMEEIDRGEQSSSGVRFTIQEEAESSGWLNIMLELQQTLTIWGILSGNVL